MKKIISKILNIFFGWKPSNLKAVIYTRVSSDSQHKDFRIKRQLEDLEQLVVKPRS